MFSSCVRQAVVQLDNMHRNVLVADPARLVHTGDTVLVANYSGGKWELVDLSNIVGDTTVHHMSGDVSYRLGTVKEVRN